MVARHHDADIAIIGGGPAGAAAAITCARRGHAVILLERDVAFTERPGETMHPGVGSILTQLGFGDQLDQIATGLHTGIWIEWGSTPRFEPYGSDESGPWRGFHLWRPSFDTALLDLAKTAGAAIHKGVSVTGLSAMNGQIERINTREGDVTARIVIDASGRSSHMARQLGVQYQARSPALIARYGYVTGSCPRRDDAPKISGDRDGWTWTAKIHDGLYQWTRVDFTAIARDD